MNGGTPKRRQSGFTIIEVLIVLAISGALLISAFLLINGKQNVTSFNQSIRDIQTQMQKVVNEVGSGYYPDDNDIKCTKGGPGGYPQLTTTTGSEQGSNSDCMFIGKVVQFGLKDTDPQQYNVYSVVGLRSDDSQDLGSAMARLIARSTTDPNGVPDEFETDRLQYGLTISKMYYNNNQSTKFGAIGFTSNFGTIGDADGSQHVNVVAIPSTDLGVDKATGVGQINKNLGAAVVNPPDGVQICFNSGGTDQSGLLTIGGAGRQGNVELKIFPGQDCI